jgi:uncharacterized protein YyaL (SSP411 family)
MNGVMARWSKSRRRRSFERRDYRSGALSVQPGKPLNGICWVIALAMFSASLFAGDGVPRNQLAGSSSPYLIAHSSDRVNWQPWRKAALEQAQAKNQLLLVSVGYYACYWCHVTQRESYQDAPAADVINARVVPVKVDRELHPALDAHLMSFVERTTGRAGWPLHVLVTPEGYPLLGFTYVPKAELIRIINVVADRWNEDAPRLALVARRADLELRAHQTVSGAARPLDAAAAEALYEALLAQAMTLADSLAGGFGEQAKFPSVAQLEILLDAEVKKPDEERRAFIDLTLSQMATQGLRDQVGGGFFRYVTDPAWQTPHFEKMLYDNALIARLYARAAKKLDRPGLARIAMDTLRFMLDELWHPDGGFIGSLSADDIEGREGNYYLVNESLIESRLTEPEAAAIRIAWALDKPSEHADGHLPVQAKLPESVSMEMKRPIKEVRAILDSARTKLAAARDRSQLPRDTKRLAGWNGLALSAMVAAGMSDSAQARIVATLLAQTLWDGEHLARARTDGIAQGTASLQDYAFAAEGLLDYGVATGDQPMMAVAASIVEAAWQRFHGEGGWRLADDEVIVLAEPALALPDRSLHSPAATLVRTTLALADSLLSEVLRDKARLSASLLPPDALSNPFFYASHVANAAWAAREK